MSFFMFSTRPLRIQGRPHTALEYIIMWVVHRLPPQHDIPAQTCFIAFFSTACLDTSLLSSLDTLSKPFPLEKCGIPHLLL